MRGTIHEVLRSFDLITPSCTGHDANQCLNVRIHIRVRVGSELGLVMVPSLHSVLMQSFQVLYSYLNHGGTQIGARNGGAVLWRAFKQLADPSPGSEVLIGHDLTLDGHLALTMCLTVPACLAVCLIVSVV